MFLTLASWPPSGSLAQGQANPAAERKVDTAVARGREQAAAVGLQVGIWEATEEAMRSRSLYGC